MAKSGGSSKKTNKAAGGTSAGGKSTMSKADLEHFRTLLLDRRRRILTTVTDMEEEALKAADQDFSVDSFADHGTDNYDQELTISLVESERKELHEIDRALARIRNGGFGICEGTGEPIARARLEAIPYARYSIDYQRKVEAGEINDDEDES